jgi:DNA-binding SARP family transcriptional activator
MMDIKLFGPTVVVVDGVVFTASELGGVKPRQILEMLAVELGSPVAKDRIAEQLWEDQPPASYVATLESYVCVLRRRLGLGKGSALVTTNNGYLLDPERTRVDLVDFRTLLASSKGEPADVVVDRTERALDLITGEMLASEPYAAWANHARETLDREIVTACTHAAHLANADGAHARAAHLAEQATGRGSFTETACQELMRALAAQGRRGEALQAYADLRARMIDDLGIEPGPVSRRLYLDILGRTSPARGSDRHEIRTLLRLLRQALDAGARPDPLTEPGLSEMALLLSRQTG